MKVDRFVPAELWPFSVTFRGFVFLAASIEAARAARDIFGAFGEVVIRDRATGEVCT